MECKCTSSDITELDQKYIMGTYGRYPICLAKGRGAQAWDKDGKEYLDFLGGIAVNALGHCHPNVVDAITRQAGALIHCSNLYFTAPAVDLSRLLVQNGGLDKVFFCNSGTEANEGAFKLARKYHFRKGQPERTRIISFEGAFHGRTAAALAATPKPMMQEGFGPMPPHFESLPPTDMGALQERLESGQVAAVIVEPVQGEGGVHPIAAETLKEIRRLTAKTGTLLIFDEIQCGMGRLGGTLFAYQSLEDVQPDIITLAKGLGGGMPIGAICAVQDVAEAGFRPGDHGTTFGANPVACAAALATVHTILNEDLLRKVTESGNHLLSSLRALQEELPTRIDDIRGRGLMLGIQLDQRVDGPAVLQKLHSEGLLANVVGGNTLRLLPPYIVTRDEIDRAVGMIRRALLSD